MMPLLRRSITTAAAAVLLLEACAAQADDVRAFHNTNQLPFKQIFGLPSLDNSPLAETGKWRLNLIGNISNTYNIAVERHEELANDLETFRGSLIASYGLRNN